MLLTKLSDHSPKDDAEGNIDVDRTGTLHMQPDTEAPVSAPSSAAGLIPYSGLVLEHNSS